MPALLAELTCYYSELSGGGAGLNEVGPEYERNVPRPVPLLIEAGVSQPVEDH
jgi:hypothetical protein